MVKSADRTLDVFELFASQRQPLFLTDISRALDAPLSSCFNLVAALKERGYLYDIGGRRQVYPTRKMLELANVTAAHEPWAMRLESKILKIRDSSRETCILGRLQGDEALYLAVYEGTQTIRYNAHAGERKPLHSSAMGKALLSAMDKTVRDAIVSRIELARRTKTTITSKKQLIAALDSIADTDIAISRGENVVDVMAIATPFRVGSELYALSIAGPITRMEQNFDSNCQRLVALGAELSKAA